MSKLEEFKKDPFGYVDHIHLMVKGKDLNIFSDDRGIRKVAFWFAFFCLIMWVLEGFDSSTFQIIYAGWALPSLLLGHINWSQFMVIYNQYYGKEMHWSAFVIYVFLYWAVSRNFLKVGVYRTKNVLYSFAAMFLAAGLFEWFWMSSFATFQHQPWVITWQMPQMRILLQDFLLVLAGGLGAFYIWVDSFKLENHVITGRFWTFQWKSWKLWVLVGLSAASALFWIYYPGSVPVFSVSLKNGQIWHSSRLFPQTLYTINLNPGGSVNAGTWFYFQNNLVHGVNTGVKSIWALTVYYFFKVKKVWPK